MKKKLLSGNSFFRDIFPKKLIKGISALLYKGRESIVFSVNTGTELDEAI